jgi:hypothetical protein
VVYVLLLDELERHVLAERQIVAAHNASGNFEAVPLPSFIEYREMFDAALVEVPRADDSVDAEQMQLRRALGVAD